MQCFNLLSKYRIPIATGLIFILGLFIYAFKSGNQIEDLYLESINKSPETELQQGLEMIAPSDLDQEDSANQPAESLEEVFIVIDVAGEVVNPSIYMLPEGSRIYQAIDAAGGLSSKADTSLVNLAAVLYDGTKLYIPKKNEQATVIQTSGSSGPASVPGEPGLINLNTADSTELQKLSGVGPATAEKILTYRREYGGFNKIEDLMNVSGIGEKTFAKLKSQICVN